MKKGLTAVGLMLVITVTTWALSTPANPILHLFAVAQLCGALALTGFAAGLVISTRLPVITALFVDDHKMTTVHKWVGIVSVCFVLVHIGLLVYVTVADNVPPLTSMLAHIGPLAATCFVGLTVIALVGAKMKHSTWLAIHKFMAVPYVIGLVHYYGCSFFKPLGLTPLSIWMDLLTLAGLSAAVYGIFLRRPTT